MLFSWMEGEESHALIAFLNSEGKSAGIWGAGIAFGIVTNTIRAKRIAGFILEGGFWNTFGSAIKNIHYYLIIAIKFLAKYLQILC